MIKKDEEGGEKNKDITRKLLNTSGRLEEAGRRRNQRFSVGVGEEHGVVGIDFELDSRSS